jgi:hypothetical protein
MLFDRVLERFCACVLGSYAFKVESALYSGIKYLHIPDVWYKVRLRAKPTKLRDIKGPPADSVITNRRTLRPSQFSVAPRN